MISCKNFYSPICLNDALLTMSQSPDEVAVLAGGTDLLLDILQGRRPTVDTLVDITNISEMKVLEQRQDQIFIGAVVTHRKIADAPLIVQHAQALAEASGLIQLV